MARTSKAKAKFYGTGRRKSSIARVYLVPGTGNITINKIIPSIIIYSITNNTLFYFIGITK